MTERTDPPNRWQIPFFTIWTGQALSTLWSRVAQFAIVWWLTQETGSAVVLTTATLIGMLPMIFLGPVAGALVDRFERRTILIVSDGVTALATLALAFVYWQGNVQLWHLYLLMFIGGLAQIFQYAAMAASTTLMVPELHLTRVQGANQMLQGILIVAGPPLGALMVGLIAMETILLLDAVTALFAIVPLFFIPIPQPVKDEGAELLSIWGDIRTGISYITARRGLLYFVLLAMMINLLVGPAASIMPLLITEHFGGGALQLGWLQSLLGLGMFAGGLLLGIWGGFKRKALVLPPSLFAVGVGILLAGIAPASMLWLALVGFFIIGAASSALNGTVGALMQTTVEPAMQGRIFTVMGSGSQAAMPIGLLIAGPTVDQFGPQSWFQLAALICLIVGPLMYFIPAMMRLEDMSVSGSAAEPAEAA